MRIGKSICISRSTHASRFVEGEGGLQEGECTMHNSMQFLASGSLHRQQSLLWSLLNDSFDSFGFDCRCPDSRDPHWGWRGMVMWLLTLIITGIACGWLAGWLPDWPCRPGACLGLCVSTCTATRSVFHYFHAAFSSRFN